MKVGLLLSQSNYKTFAVTERSVEINPGKLDPDVYWLTSTPTNYRYEKLSSWVDVQSIYQLSDQMSIEAAQAAVKDIQTVMPAAILTPGKILKKCLFDYLPWIYQTAVPVPIDWCRIVNRVRVEAPKGATQIKLNMLEGNIIENIRLPLKLSERRIQTEPKTFKASKPALYQVELSPSTSRRFDQIKLLDQVRDELVVVTNNQLLALKEHFDCRLIDSLQITARENDWLEVYEHPAFKQCGQHRDKLRLKKHKSMFDRHVVSLILNMPTNTEHPYSIFTKGQLWARTLNIAIESELEGQKVTSFSYDTIWTEE